MAERNESAGPGQPGGNGQRRGGGLDERPLGRPDDAGSRQQNEPDQIIETGSPELDERATRRTGGPTVPEKPPGPK